MKILYRLMLPAMVLLGIAGCQEKPDEIPSEQPAEEVTLEIYDNLVQVGAKGGEYSFTYTFTGGDIADLKAEGNADWISGIDLSSEGEVTFTATANSSAESRIANIILSYGKVSDKIVVSQSGIGEETLEYSFDISYEIDGPFVRMTVIPEPENTRYYAWYYSVKGMEEALAQSPGVTVGMYFKRLVEVEMSDAIYYGAYAGYSAEESVAQLTIEGPAYQDFELNGNTAFYGFVCAVGSTGEVLSDVTFKEFTTGPVAQSDNILDVVIDDVNTDRISYSVKTTNSDQYAAMVFAAEDIEGKSDADLLEMVNGLGDITSYLHFGDFSSTILVDSADADYYVTAFGYEYGMFTTEVIREKVHTLASDPDAVPTIDIDINKVTHYRIDATVSADPKTSLYYADYCLADESPEALKNSIREAAQWYVDNGYYGSLGACMKAIGSKGTNTFGFENLSPQTSYRVYAVGINELTGEFSTDVIFSDVVTTPAKEISGSYIEISVGKYFDGYDLIEAYPSEFSDADGWAVVPLEVTVNGDVADYYYDIYIGDLSDTTYPTDDELILDLEMNGISNTPVTMSYCYFNEVLTLVYFSKDNEDNNSPVTRKTFRLTPEGCSPVSEFTWYPQTTSSQPARARKMI